MEFSYNSIGIIHSQYQSQEGTPIQPVFAKGIPGYIELEEEYVPGLKDLDGFSHIILLYHFHLSRRWSPLVKPFLDNVERGVFATRAPRRPNSIGLSIVRLEVIEGNILHIRDVDIVNGTPLLDIKPFTPGFDHRDNCRCGWMEKGIKKKGRHIADARFID